MVVVGQGGGGQALAQVDLGADAVGEVADHEDVLDVVVEVGLDASGVDLGGERERAHQVLPQGVVRLALLVDDGADEVGHAVEQVGGVFEAASEALDVGGDGGAAVLGVAGGGQELEGGALGVAGAEVDDAVRDLDEEAALGGALGVDGDGGANVGLELDARVGAGVGRHGQVDGRVGERARVGRREEVLDQRAEAVQLVRRRVPAQQGLARVRPQVQRQHVLLVLHVHLHLVLVLGVRDGEGRRHGRLGPILGSRPHQGAYYP